MLFVISAPSGAGKTTLCDALRQNPDFVYAVSCTTRAPRPGEKEGEDYFFLSEADFDQRVRAGEFLEHAQVHHHRYGTLKKTVLDNLQAGQDVLIDIDTEGAHSIRQCPDRFIQSALADIFLLPPSLQELRRRLEKRGTETELEIETRIRNAKEEMKSWREYRYTIVSRSIEENLQSFRAILMAERCLTRRFVDSIS